MSLSWPVGAALVTTCWAIGTLLTVLGRNRAALLFAGRSPALVATARAQLAGTALNRLLPANAGVVSTHFRLLTQQGLPAGAVTAVLLAYAASHLLAHVTAGALVGALIVSGALPGPELSMPVPAWTPLVLLLPGALLLLPRVRRRLGPVGRHLRDGARVAMARPAAFIALALFELGTLTSLGAGLYFALQISGASVSLPIAVCVLVLCNVLAGALPAPGGTGPVEAALLGVLAALGEPAGAALAAAVVFRGVTHWLPVPLGLLAMATTRRPLSLHALATPSYAAPS